MKQYPLIQLVDKNDQPIGGASMDEIHQKGLLHRVVHIFVEDDRGNILLQKRGSKVVTYPGIWDFSAAGHVDEGEDYLQAAKRELIEEIGLTGYPLKEIDRHLRQTKYEQRILNRYVKVYKVVVPMGQKIKYEVEEVADIQWLSKQQINKLINTEPNSLTPEFIRIYRALFTDEDN